jgi:hypothetical protein
MLKSGVTSVSPAKRSKSERKRVSKEDNVMALWCTASQSIPNRRQTAIDNGVYKYSQQVLQQGFHTTSTTLTVFTGTGFVISSLDQISSLTAIFDQYRITCIEIWLIPDTNANNSTNAGEIMTVIDYDDAGNSITPTTALDYQNVQVGKCADGHYRKFVPHVAVAAYSGAFTSFCNEVSPWIDSSSTGVIHYGLKVASTTTTSAIAYDLMYRVHCEFRNVR